MSVANLRAKLSERGNSPDMPRLVNRSISATLARAFGSSAKTMLARASRLSTAHRVESKSKMMGFFGMNRPYRESDPFSGMEFGTLDERIDEDDRDDLSFACSGHP